MLTNKQFMELFPTASNVDSWVFAINTLTEKYKITGVDLAQFLAQCGHESGGFTVFIENLNYSRDGLLKIFPKYFDIKSAEIYARKPMLIANRVYANRMGNGSEVSGDGWKYRGRCPVQCTGKNNYAAFSKWYFQDDRCVVDPDLLLDPMVSVAFVCWFWTTNKISALALKEDTVAVTKKINGGTHGLEDRKLRYAKAKKVLGLA